jgi:hypothetical protein
MVIAPDIPDQGDSSGITVTSGQGHSSSGTAAPAGVNGYAAVASDIPSVNRGSQKPTDPRVDRYNPLHTGVTKDTASTPGYFRLFLPGMAARYVLRWSIGTLERFGALPDRGAKEFFHKIEETLKEPVNLPKQQFNVDKGKFEYDETTYTPALREAISAYEVEGGNAQSLLRAQRHYHLKEIWKDLDNQYRNYRNITGKEDLIKSVRENSQSFESTLHQPTLLENQQRIMQDDEVWESFKSEVKGKRKSTRGTIAYDTALGVGSTALTLFYARRVASDVKKVFAETVAFEEGKKPDEITYQDILQSKNPIVKETVHNFFTKNATRLATDAMFFMGRVPQVRKLVKHLPGFDKNKELPIIAFSDLGVGIKGAQLMSEVLRKDTTMFEDLLQLIDNKLNPMKGIGDPIKTAEVLDIYQKYAAYTDSNRIIRDATIRQNNDDLDWPKAEVMFSRIADIMNKSYKYKHRESTPVGQRMAGETALDDGTQGHFALPELLYLMGNGMINPFEPEKSLVYIEVANQYDAKTLKNVKSQIDKGGDVREVASQYDIDIDQLLRKATPNASKPTTVIVQYGKGIPKDTTAATITPENIVDSIEHARLVPQEELGRTALQ